MESIETRGMKTAERYLNLKGYEVMDVIGDHIVSVDESDVIHIVAVKTIEAGQDNRELGTRSSEEMFAALYANDSDWWDDNQTVQFDAINIMVTGAERALLRHHKNRFSDADDL